MKRTLLVGVVAVFALSGSVPTVRASPGASQRSASYLESVTPSAPPKLRWNVASCTPVRTSCYERVADLLNCASQQGWKYRTITHVVYADCTVFDRTTDWACSNTGGAGSAC